MPRRPARKPRAAVLRLFASLDSAGTWRSWRRRAPAGWTPAPGTWPRTGMLRAGHAYALTEPKAPKTPRPAAALMPTPTAADGSGGPGTSPKRTGGPNLRTVVTTLPTDREDP